VYGGNTDIQRSKYLCSEWYLSGWQAGTNLILRFLEAVGALKIISLKALLLQMGKPRHKETK
jgi:hypothetical protein